MRRRKFAEGTTAQDMEVTEEQVIGHVERLNLFVQNPEERELAFPPTLTKAERAAIHDECKKFGLTSKSYGNPPNRHIVVRKPKERSVEDTRPYPLEFCPAAAQAIQRHFGQHPLSVEEIEKTERLGMFSKASNSTPKEHEEVQQDVARMKQVLAAKPDVLQQGCQAMKKRLEGTVVQKFRERLPSWESRCEVTTIVKDNPVVLISGETGCGKTTQVPQFIIEDCHSRGEACNIVCTQPRRISAVTVAERVAVERGEAIGQGGVGYNVRLDSKSSPNNVLVFCTPGVILRKMRGNPKLEGVTHIIVDEVHERDKFQDFLLILLKDLLNGPRPDLKVVLMSATLNAQLFSTYFNECPVVHIPGYTFPTQEFFLDDVLQLVGYRPKTTTSQVGKPQTQSQGQPQQEEESLVDNDTMDNALINAFVTDDFEELLDLIMIEGGSVNHQHSQTKGTPLHIAAAKGRLDVVTTLLARGANVDIKSSDDRNAHDWALTYGHTEVANKLKTSLSANQDSEAAALVAAYQKELFDADQVDIALVDNLVHHICTSPTYPTGAILIFMTGWDDINRLRDRLLSRPGMDNPNKYRILALHSMVSMQEQKSVFQKPPEGVRKVIIATNIAETSITIDDVVFVLNAGLKKEKSFDPFMGTSTLQTAWIDQNSQKQRKGRAGRCQEGFCFHLYSRVRSQSLQQSAQAELLRTPLEELSLQVKTLATDDSIAEFLGKAVEPPFPQAVASAVTLLKEIDALDEEENLTNLGKYLAALPLHPKIGKMVLSGIMFNCLLPVLTIACADAVRDPFIIQSGPGGQARLKDVKKRFSAGSYSDHIAVINAFNEFESCRRRNHAAQYGFCNQNLLSAPALSMISSWREQVLMELMGLGLISDINAHNENATNIAVIKAIVFAGFYPSFGQYRVFRGREPIVVSKSIKNLKIHQASVNSQIEGSGNRFRFNAAPNTPFVDGDIATYDEITRGNRLVYIKECTILKPHILVLLALDAGIEKPAPREKTEGDEDEEEDEEDDQPQPDQSIVKIDGWCQYLVRDAIAQFLHPLRNRLERAFFQKISHPSEDLTGQNAAVTQLMVDLIIEQGKADHSGFVQFVGSNDRGRGRGRGRGSDNRYSGRGRGDYRHGDRNNDGWQQQPQRGRGGWRGGGSWRGGNSQYNQRGDSGQSRGGQGRGGWGGRGGRGRGGPGGDDNWRGRGRY